MSSRYLAFDLGASSGRAIVGELADGKLKLSEAHRFENGAMEKDGSLFWDFAALTNEIKTGLKKVLDESSDLDGIGVDTWGVDYLLLKKDGSYARAPYNYRDARTDDVPDRLHGIAPFEQLYERTGIQFMQLNTIYQLFAHKEDHPEDFDDAVLLFMPDALTHELSGVVESEYCIASTSGMLDATARQWDRELIEKIGLPASILPSIVPPSSRAGVLTDAIQKELGCGPIPVYHAGSHDTASAVASVPAPEGKNWAYISCGTWALLGAELDKPLLTPEAREASFTNEGGLDGKIRFLTNIMGMWLIQECRRVWKEAGKKLSFDEMDAAAEAAEPVKYIVDPNHSSFFAPGNMPKFISDFCENTGQGSIEDDGAIIRCALDSLAIFFRKKVRALEELLDVKLDGLNIVGGGVQNKLLMRLTADCLGIPVTTGPVEATAIGNVLSQAMGAGEIASLAEARNVVKSSFEVEEFRPNPDKKAMWDQATEKFDALVAE